MKPRDAGILASRILAIYFGTQAIVNSVSYLVLVAEAGSFAGGSFVASFITQGVVAAVLWVASGAIGEALARGASETEPAAPRPLDHLRGVAILIVGLALAALAVPQLVAAIVTDSPFGVAAAFFTGAAAGIAGAVTQLVIGSGLMIYGWTVTRSAPTSASPLPRF